MNSDRLRKKPIPESGGGYRPLTFISFDRSLHNQQISSNKKGNQICQKNQFFLHIAVNLQLKCFTLTRPNNLTRNGKEY